MGGAQWARTWCEATHREGLPAKVGCRPPAATPEAARRSRLRPCLYSRSQARLGHPRTGNHREHAPGPEPLIPQGLRSPPPDSPGGFSRELFPETGARRWALPAAALGPSRGSIPPTYPRMCDDLVSSFVDAGGKKCRAQQGRRGKSPSSGAGDGGVPAWGGGVGTPWASPCAGEGGTRSKYETGSKTRTCFSNHRLLCGVHGLPCPSASGPCARTACLGQRGAVLGPKEE